MYHNIQNVFQNCQKILEIVVLKGKIAPSADIVIRHMNMNLME
jgi:hypothetical protein